MPSAQSPPSRGPSRKTRPQAHSGCRSPSVPRPEELKLLPRRLQPGPLLAAGPRHTFPDMGSCGHSQPQRAQSLPAENLWDSSSCLIGRHPSSRGLPAVRGPVRLGRSPLANVGSPARLCTSYFISSAQFLSPHKRLIRRRCRGQEVATLWAGGGGSVSPRGKLTMHIRKALSQKSGPAGRPVANPGMAVVPGHPSPMSRRSPPPCSVRPDHSMQRWPRCTRGPTEPGHHRAEGSCRTVQACDSPTRRGMGSGWRWAGVGIAWTLPGGGHRPGPSGLLCVTTCLLSLGVS